MYRPPACCCFSFHRSPRPCVLASYCFTNGAHYFFCFGVPTGHAVHIMGLGFFKTAAQPAVFQRFGHIAQITKYPPVRGKMYQLLKYAAALSFKVCTTKSRSFCEKNSILCCSLNLAALFAGFCTSSNRLNRSISCFFV